MNGRAAKPRSLQQAIFRLWWVVVPLVVMAIYLCAVEKSARGSPATRPAELSIARSTLFDASAEHPWNRLHAALFVRTAADGQRFGDDEVDLLLWASTNFLIEGDSHAGAIAEMDRFLAEDASGLIQEPVKRAVLQSELWALFDWTAGRSHGPGQPAQISALQSRLARIISQLALSDERIRNLPDNYAQAVASHRWAGGFDPAAPQKPFLPADLFQRDGPWILIGSPRMTTPMHFHFVSGRSVFSVFMQVPGGRQAALNYLNRLDVFGKPLVIQAAGSPAPGRVELNPDLPQFPEGTQLALLRQMVLIDDGGGMVASHLAENLQIRVYRRIAYARRGGEQPQAVFEFRMKKSGLFSGRDGGLAAVQPGDEAFLLFQSMGIDPIEDELRKQPYRDPRSPALNCMECHGSAGVFSFLSCEQAAMGNYGSPQLREAEMGLAANVTADQKRMQYDWGLLQGLMRLR